MKHESKDLREKSILERINALEPQQIAEVMDFIEFLVEKKQKENPLVRFLQESVGPPVGLEELRTRLAKIRGQMSDVVREQRDERG
jgi:Protein of unknown function (DUF2281)